MNGSRSSICVDGTTCARISPPRSSTACTRVLPIAPRIVAAPLASLSARIFAFRDLCMFLNRPPIKDSSASTTPASFLSKDFALIAARMRCSMNHAVFCVTSSARWISYEETPFLQLMSIQTAEYHLPREIGESSKIVPTLTENCFLQVRERHDFRDRIRAMWE